MGEINFIAEKKNGKKNKPKEEPPKIEWSTPAKEDKKNNSNQEQGGWLSFFKKKNNPTENPVNTKIDLDKINSSRNEVLKLIKEYELKNSSKPRAKISFFGSWFGGKKSIAQNREVTKIAEKTIPLSKNNKEKSFDIIAKTKNISSPRLMPPDNDIKPVLSTESPAIVSPLKKLSTEIGQDIQRLKQSIAETKITAENNGKQPIEPLAEAKKTIADQNQAKNLAVEAQKISWWRKIWPKKTTDKADKKIIQPNSETDKWQSQPALETNLIEKEMVFFFDWQENALIAIIGLVSTVFLLALGYSGLVYWEKSHFDKIKELENSYSELDRKIILEAKTINEIIDFKNKSSLVGELLNKHIYWSNFFNWLEENTLADVYFQSFSGDISGNYKLSAQARNYYTVAEQLNFMEANNLNKGILNYTKVQEVGYGRAELGAISGANFILEISLNPDIFYKIDK